MSRRKQKKIRVRDRWNQMVHQLDELLDSFMYEPFSECKDVLSDEIIKITKKFNVASHFGREWVVKSKFDPSSNESVFDVRTKRSYFRVIKVTK